MATYGNATNHVMWAVSKWGMMAWPIQSAISSRLRTLAPQGMVPKNMEKTWKIMESWPACKEMTAFLSILP